MVRQCVFVLSLVVVYTLQLTYASGQSDSKRIVDLAYAPAPVANPLKGLVPYASQRTDPFPHTMEFNYVSLAELMKGYDQFDWEPLEALLDDIASRGHQTVFRVYLEYPGKLNMIPQFLRDEGLVVHRYLNTNTAPFPAKEVETPDYEDPRLRRAFKNFITKLGQRYDGDPRIGYITAGLLGTWGEWHTYPRSELFASKMVQAEVMDAYEMAFKQTPVLLRYPAGEDTWGKAPNAKRPFGYHDDSFAWATLDTGNKEDNWFYMPALTDAGVEALEKWKTQPIGGEIRPEAWGKVFDEEPGDKQIQDFRKCVETTHATWLMDTGMFQKSPSKARYARASEEVRRMGYEFHVRQVTIEQEAKPRLQIEIDVENRGVAPFYANWPVEYGVLADRRLVHSYSSNGKLVGLLPGEDGRRWTDELDLSQLARRKYVLAIRVPNALANGTPLRFANATQDQDLDGWLSLAEIEVR